MHFLVFEAPPHATDHSVPSFTVLEEEGHTKFQPHACPRREPDISLDELQGYLAHTKQLLTRTAIGAYVIHNRCYSAPVITWNFILLHPTWWSAGVPRSLKTASSQVHKVALCLGG